jgi:hypothetical protein
MRTTFKNNSSRHQIVVSLAPRSALAVHFHCGLLGWRRRHEVQFDLPNGDDFFLTLQRNLLENISSWKIPSNSSVAWILTPDILGIVSNPLASPEMSLSAPPLPFAQNQVRTQIDNFNESGASSLLWIHNDWVAEIERISRECNLQLVECFARAQIFQKNIFEKKSSGLQILIESASNAHCLHIYGNDGKILRSRILEEFQDISLSSTIAAEISSIKHRNRTSAPTPISVYLADSEIGKLQNFSDYKIVNRTNWGSAYSILERFWRSDLEGIVIRPIHQRTIRGLLVFSGVLCAIGLVLLTALVWHDGKLREISDTQTADLRRMAPEVKKADAQRYIALKNFDFIKAAKQFEEEYNATETLSQVLAVFPSPPATITYFHASPQKLEIYGQGSEADVVKLKNSPISGYSEFTESPAPESSQEIHSGIHLQAKRSVSQSQSTKP